MFTKQICLLAIYILTFQTPFSLSCSRSYSKTARNLLTEKGFFEFIERFDLPENCPLRPENDIFGSQEEHKHYDTFSKWGCGFCGKFFTSEHFLDSHFDRKHVNERRIGVNAICLADYCDILRCDVLSEISIPSYWELALCVESKFENLREKCQRIVQDCIDTSWEERNVEIFLNTTHRMLCSDLRCEKYYFVNKDSISDYLFYFFKYLWLLLTFCFICVLYIICCSVKLYQSEMEESKQNKDK